MMQVSYLILYNRLRRLNTRRVYYTARNATFLSPVFSISLIRDCSCDITYQNQVIRNIQIYSSSLLFSWFSWWRLSRETIKSQWISIHHPITSLCRPRSPNPLSFPSFLHFFLWFRFDPFILSDIYFVLPTQPRMEKKYLKPQSRASKLQTSKQIPPKPRKCMVSISGVSSDPRRK